MVAVDKLSPSFVLSTVLHGREYSLGVSCLTVSLPNLFPISSLIIGRRNRESLGSASTIQEQQKMCVLKMMYESQIKKHSTIQTTMKKINSLSSAQYTSSYGDSSLVTQNNAQSPSIKRTDTIQICSRKTCPFQLYLLL